MNVLILSPINESASFRFPLTKVINELLYLVTLPRFNKLKVTKPPV